MRSVEVPNTDVCDANLRRRVGRHSHVSGQLFEHVSVQGFHGVSYAFEQRRGWAVGLLCLSDVMIQQCLLVRFAEG